MHEIMVSESEIDLLSINPKDWNSLAQAIETMWPVTVVYAKRAAQGGLKIGEMILNFSARPEILEEMKAANQNRPGRKFTPLGFVAEKLSKEFGARLPCVRHLRDCARAAEIIQNGGSSEHGIRALLGWKGNGKDEFPEVTIPKLPAPKTARADKPRKTDIELALYHFKRIEVDLQELLAAKVKLKFKGDEYDAYSTQIEKVKEYFKLLRFELEPFK